VRDPTEDEVAQDGSATVLPTHALH
jgi:hypothetical protein